MAWTMPLLYERLTWPEVRRAAAEDRVCLIPAGTLEDHGPHLPLDADTRIATEICRRAAEEIPDQVVLLPPIIHGYTPHHMDFPGPITIGWETFVRYCTDIGNSLAHHGFKRILYLNGHGSNIPLVEMAARLVALEHPDVLAAGAFYLTSAESMKVIEEVRESDIGGMGHACEMETSLQLHLRPELVAMANARKDMPKPATSLSGIDFREPGPLVYPLDFRRDSSEGVMGDPTAATPEKGAAIADAVLEKLVQAIGEFRVAPIRKT